MRQSETGQAIQAPVLLGAVAPRFPLVPRPRPRCQALDVRVAQVRDLAHAAAQDTDTSLVRAAEAHNLAALIVSDCGLPDLARDLCWRQFDVPHTRAGDGKTAQLALQPIINLARLHIRDGDGNGAYHLLNALLRAAKTRTDMVVDSRTIRFGDIIGPGDDRHEIVSWLWTVLISDGTRALTRAGRWAEALQHVQQHKGIGNRLLDGRQVAIIAHCAARDYGTARRLLAGTSTPTPWEEAVAACLTALCFRLADRPADSGVATMVDRYLGLEPVPEQVVFRVRLGLCVIDLAAGARGVPQVAGVVVRDALEAADAYAAHDALSHDTCRSHTPAASSRALTAIVRAAGLGRGALPADLLEDLMESIRTSEAAMAGAIEAWHGESI